MPKNVMRKPAPKIKPGSMRDLRQRAKAQIAKIGQGPASLVRRDALRAYLGEGTDGQ